MIAAEQIQSFHDNGYVIFRHLVSREEAVKFRSITERDLEQGTGPVEFEAEVAYPGAPSSLDALGGGTVRRLRQAYSRDAVFATWATDDRISQRLQQLFGCDSLHLVLNHHNCVMTKHPRYSSGTHWHQDNRYWSYHNNDLITVWLALGLEEQANGGMYVIPGTHRMTFAEDRYDQALFLREDNEQNQNLIEQAVLAELEPGDALFFHSNLFHAAGRNLTEKSKFALVFTYRRSDNQPIDVATGEQDIALR